MSRRDEYDYDDDEVPGQKVWGIASILVGLAALAGFIALAWYAYSSGSTTQDPASAELVRAESTPYKEVPKDPGGWQAPHRDKTIYEVIDTNAKKAPATAERLTAAPEEPMDVANTSTSESGTSTWMNAKLRNDGSDVPLTDAERQKAAQEEKPEAAAEPKKPEPAKPEVVSEAPVKTEPAKPETHKPDAEAIAAAVAKGTAVSTEALKASPIEGGRLEGGGAAYANAGSSRSTPTPPSPLKGEGVTAAKARAEAKAALPKAAASIKGGNARVQLGAFRSEGEAAAHVKHLGSRVPGILSGKSTTVERADLGEKGVYYRLFGLGFSHEEASAACARIKAARLDCMVK